MMVHYKKFIPIIQRLDKIYDDALIINQIKVINSCVNLTTFVVKFVTYLYAGTIFIYAIGPIVIYPIIGKFILFYEVFVPFIDYTTPFGLVVNYIFSLMLDTYSLAACLATDIAWITICCHVVTKANLIELRMRDFAKFMEETDGKTAQKNQNCIDEELKLICQQHFDVLSFIEEINEFYGTYCTATIYTATPSCLFTLMVLVYANWWTCVIFLAVMIFQLAWTCFLGTVIQNQSDKIFESICQLPWYLLPLKNKKDFSFLMLHANKSVAIDVFMVGELNVATFVDVSSN